MIFHPRLKKIDVNVPLVMENIVNKQVVDVIIDQHLSCESHI